MKPKMKSYYMRIAEETAGLSYAKKLQVGAIIVKDNRIISIGFNGMPSGWSNECETINKSLIQDWMHPDDYALYNVYKTKPEVLHAEANAITKLARCTESGEGASIFVTHTPCIECAKLIYQAGIDTVYYGQDYEANKGCGFDFLKTCGIHVEKVNPNEH